jgi:hypothetical protein
MSGLCVGPGPRSLEGLAWLARVGASPAEPLRLVVGWTKRLALDHVSRLERAGLVTRIAMRRGHGSLVVITSRGAIEVGYPAARAPRSVEPSNWAHASGCAWTAAWLVLRLRELRETAPEVPRGAMEWWGERDIFGDDFWRREVRHKDHQRGTVRATHRPDLGVRLGGLPLPVEVELQRKSRARLRGILSMYEELATADESRFAGVIYVTGTPDIADGVRRAAGDVGLSESVLTLRSYPDVVAQTRAAAASNHKPAPQERPDLGDAA